MFPKFVVVAFICTIEPSESVMGVVARGGYAKIDADCRALQVTSMPLDAEGCAKMSVEYAQAYEASEKRVAEKRDKRNLDPRYNIPMFACMEKWAGI